MEEEKRLGNKHKGWNDPPSFTYDKHSQAQKTPRKNLLNQRVAMPQNHSPSTTGGLSNQAHSTPPSGAPPPSGPPPSTGIPPATGPPPLIGPPPTSGASVGAGPTRMTHDASSVGKAPVFHDGTIEEISCEATVTMFRKVFEECKEKLQKRVISDIERRLKLLKDSWQSNKLSSPVKRKTAKLAADLQARRYDSAHEIHLALMIDHVGEVSQWMVGIKRLIHEARTILPLQDLEPHDKDVEVNEDRTVVQDQELSSGPTARGDADSIEENTASEKADIEDRSRTDTNEEEARKEVENLDIVES